MNKQYKYLFLVLAVCCLFGCKMPKQKRMPSLKETYSKADKNPFGSYIAYHQLANMFSHNVIRDKKLSFDKTWNDIYDSASMYVCISPALYVNEEEVKAMMGYVNAGNTLFIASSYIDSNLLKEIGCSLNQPSSFFYDSLQNTRTSFRETPYSYYYHTFSNSISYSDSVFTKVLGVNEKGAPNFILYFHGKGKLILHCDARAFSNYFLLSKNNYQFIQEAFAYTAAYPEHLYWDDYYLRVSARRKTNTDGDNFSSFSEIMKHPPLAAAFWLALIMLALYLAFGSKRRQRVIPERKSNENTSVTFTETIGRLYLQKKDNKNIAEKMITYFNEHVRNSYFLNTNVVDDEFITTLSRKSGVNRGAVESLYRAMQHAHQSAVVDDYQLLSLNQQIQHFYKK